MPSQGRTARERCYAELLANMKAGFLRYVQEYPERAGDERNIEAQSWSMRGLQRMIRILDRYQIEDIPKRNGANKAPQPVQPPRAQP